MPKLNEVSEPLALPPFVVEKPIFISANYRVVMGYKPGTKNTVRDQRFFIEPTTDEGEKMLMLATKKHNITSNIINAREVPNETGTTKLRQCVRANFETGNLPSFLWGQIDIPDGSEDTMPSPRRMEECLMKHPQEYTFQD